MLEIIEDKLTEKLKEGFEGFDIESFPADFKSYSFTSPTGCILLRYDASAFSSQQSINQVSQKETYEYAVFLAVRGCYTFKDSYPYLKRLKNALQGLDINGFKVILKKRSYIQQKTSDLWWGTIINVVFPTGETSK